MKTNKIYRFSIKRRVTYIYSVKYTLSLQGKSLHKYGRKIRHLLASLVHPETGQDIVSSGFIEHIASAAGKITVVFRFAKARDPFAVKIKTRLRNCSNANSPIKRYW